jgi:hypothetical protein
LGRYIAILFFLLLSAAGCLIGLSYQWKIRQVKRAVKEALAAGIIEYEHVIVFRKSEINNASWTEPYEFCLGNKMYDVFRTDTVGDELFYHCILDNEEGVWINLLLAFMQSEKSLTKNKDFLPLKFLLKDLMFYYELTCLKYFAHSQLIIFCCNHLTTQSSATLVFIPPEII